MLQRKFIGIDVSKARLDVAFRPGGGILSISNDVRGIAAHQNREKRRTGVRGA
jgi:hypothetical protein